MSGDTDLGMFLGSRPAAGRELHTAACVPDPRTDRGAGSPTAALDPRGSAEVPTTTSERPTPGPTPGPPVVPTLGQSQEQTTSWAAPGESAGGQNAPRIPQPAESCGSRCPSPPSDTQNSERPAQRGPRSRRPVST